MTSRERVRMALAHKEADRVPVDLWGSASRIQTDLYLKIIEELKFTEPGSRIRPGTATEFVDFRLSDYFNVDFRHIDIRKPREFQSYTDAKGNIIDEWGVGRKVIGHYPTITYHPLAEAEAEDLDNYKWPFPEDEGRIEGLAEQAKEWYTQTDKAITATSAVSGQFFDMAQFLRGSENFFVDLYNEPLFAEKLIDKITETLIRINLHYLKPIAPYIEWVEFSSDLGTQSAPFISKQLFQKFFKEPFRRMFSTLKKEYPNVKMFLHSCGAIYDFIPDLIDTGLDILNPLQPLAYGMDGANIKKNFGKDLVLHGGVDIQQALPGTLAEVENEVKRCMNIFGPGGGYVCSTSNHIQPDVPVENVIKFFEYAREYGEYKKIGNLRASAKIYKQEETK